MSELWLPTYPISSKDLHGSCWSIRNVQFCTIGVRSSPFNNAFTVKPLLDAGTVPAGELG
jgi:hypothetical protein